jgi:hypothetical protein
MVTRYGNISDARNLLKEIGFETNQTHRAAERDIEFIEFIFRDAKPKQFARNEYLAYREIRKEQNENDILNFVREKTERYITSCPDSLFFIIQVMGLLRGLRYYEAYRVLSSTFSRSMRASGCCRLENTQCQRPRQILF